MSNNQKFKIWFLNSDYLNYLKNKSNLDLKLKDFRPHISYVGFEINGFKYAIPLTSDKNNKYKSSHKYSLFIPRDGNDKNIDPSNKLGILHINKMIPVFENENFAYEPSINEISNLDIIANELNYLNQLEVFNKVHKLAFEARKMIDKDLKFNVDFKQAEKICTEYAILKAIILDENSEIQKMKTSFDVSIKQVIKFISDYCFDPDLYDISHSNLGNKLNDFLNDKFDENAFNYETLNYLIRHTLNFNQEIEPFGSHLSKKELKKYINDMNLYLTNAPSFKQFLNALNDLELISKRELELNGFDRDQATENLQNELIDFQLQNIEKTDFDKYLDNSVLKTVVEKVVENDNLSTKQKQNVLEQFWSSWENLFYEQTYALYDSFFVDKELPEKILNNNDYKKIFYKHPADEGVAGIYGIGTLHFDFETNKFKTIGGTQDYVGFREFINDLKQNNESVFNRCSDALKTKYREFTNLETQLNQYYEIDWSRFIVNVSLDLIDLNLVGDLEEIIKDVKEKKNEREM